MFRGKLVLIIGEYLWKVKAFGAKINQGQDETGRIL